MRVFIPTSDLELVRQLLLEQDYEGLAYILKDVSGGFRVFDNPNYLTDSEKSEVTLLFIER